jgi:O-antigen/teichoic acid export membrane protein
MKDLKQKALRGGVARVTTQGASLVLRLGTVMILARLLTPKDFGLVGMVTAFTGVFFILRDFGLSAAAIQRNSMTEEQSSTLFWINLATGAGLTLAISALSPFVATFYHEPRLVRLTIVLGFSFLFNGAGVQHSALLERQMRFSALSVLDFLSLLISTLVGIGMALIGLQYWALVATTTVYPLLYTICVWVMTRWIPGRPQRNIGIRSMLRFGSTLTLNGLLVYLGNNFDKILLGRFWGEQALGIYGRAYQLINIPPDSISSAAGGVAFAALSRIQDDPVRLRDYFLKGFSLVLSVTVPITFVCALFANDLIYVCLGAKWESAVPVFRYLAPTALTLGILMPLGWLLNAIGNVKRGLNVALVNTPLMIAAYFAGLPYGPTGVAVAFSAMRIITLIPRAIWIIHGTVVSLRDFLLSVGRPMLCAMVASLPGIGVQFLYHATLPHIARLAISLLVFGAVYAWMLLVVLGERQFYFNLIRDIIGTPSVKETASLPV